MLTGEQAAAVGEHGHRAAVRDAARPGAGTRPARSGSRRRACARPRHRDAAVARPERDLLAGAPHGGTASPRPTSKRGPARARRRARGPCGSAGCRAGCLGRSVGRIRPYPQPCEAKPRAPYWAHADAVAPAGAVDDEGGRGRRGRGGAQRGQTTQYPQRAAHESRSGIVLLRHDREGQADGEARAAHERDRSCDEPGAACGHAVDADQPFRHARARRAASSGAPGSRSSRRRRSSCRCRRPRCRARRTAPPRRRRSPGSPRSAPGRRRTRPRARGDEHRRAGGIAPCSASRDLDLDAREHEGQGQPGRTAPVRPGRRGPAARPARARARRAPRDRGRSAPAHPGACPRAGQRQLAPVGRRCRDRHPPSPRRPRARPQGGLQARAAGSGRSARTREHGRESTIRVRAEAPGREPRRDRAARVPGVPRARDRDRGRGRGRRPRLAARPVGRRDGRDRRLPPRRGALRAARETGADAVHPGYGFLAESADFAEAVEAAGLVWVGPPPAACAQAATSSRRSGSRARPASRWCRGHRRRARLPAAREGSGRRRRARHAGRPRRRTSSTRRSRRRAARRKAAFGDDAVFLERYLERPRHVEIQILADAHGTVLALGERECSIQRRHQKVVEEAPSPALDPADARAR